VIDEIEEIEEIAIEVKIWRKKNSTLSLRIY